MAPTPQPTNSSSPLAGRMTGAVIFLVVALCIALIGLAGYVKFQLDRAESLLASPEISLTPEQAAFDKIRRDLGYGGFLGIAQNYAATHDGALLNDLKNQFKLANDSFEKLPQKTPAELRRDLQAILSSFDAVVQKADKTATSQSPNDFTSTDLAPLYAALPVLDTRVASALSANRLAEQNRAQFWSMVLTIISWASLVIAAAMTAGIFLVLRDRNSAPMRALAQSVKNMARGDMRTSIWGMERQDAIGELARAVDMARFHFSQLPDMSLLSDQGPVRIRFEGNTRSLFEAMMRVISHDSEQVHEQANLLTQGVTKQQETLAHIIERVEAVLQNVEKRAVNGDQQVRQALQNMLGSAESLKNAQEHASDQLNRIVPFLQERTQGISEIAQITGKQVSQALQALSTTERGLRATAEQSEDAIKKLAEGADTLGERLFGAVNLLQASGKVLAETTATMQSKFDEAITHIGSGGMPVVVSGVSPVATLSSESTERLENITAALISVHDKFAAVPVELPSNETNERLESIAVTLAAVQERLGIVPVASLSAESTERLENIVSSLVGVHDKLTNVLADQAEVTSTHVNLLMTQNSSLLTQASTSAQTLLTASERLREEQTKMGELLIKIGAMSMQPQNTAQSVEELAAPLLADVREAFGTIEQRLSLLHSQVSTLLSASNEPAPVQPVVDNTEQMREHWFQMAGQIEASRSNLAQIIAQQTDRLEAQLAKPVVAPADNNFSREAQQQLEQQTNILHELVTTLSLLDAHMQDLRSQVTASRRVG